MVLACRPSLINAKSVCLTLAKLECMQAAAGLTQQANGCLTKQLLPTARPQK